ncbi:heparinase II/III domain-containing protein [Paenibacillus cymbidii]|uniref:heparinase II/III domain-containing protein n=1 Tax=Paenibacillus cymbidii TaxID=1639034 RepID=UPI0010809BDC|nr:heparinase II/III family protein [Paenibacillus cymbidii]
MSRPLSAKPVYLTHDDIRKARANIAAYEWAAASFADMKRYADDWFVYSDDLLRDAVMGMKEEAFAYALNGCPACGKPFPVWDLQAMKEVASDLRDWPRRTITCPHCAVVLPNEQYPDEGRGIGIGGKGYYPLGLWNFTLCTWLFGGVAGEEGLITKLLYLYLITEEERYAERAIVLLDIVSALMPDTRGPRDFAAFGSDSEYGRIHLLTSIVHRVKKYWAIDYSWLYDRQELDRPSPALARLGRQATIRANIEEMLDHYMLEEPGGVPYDLRGGNLTNLQNHETDGIKAMLAVGLALGKPSYCDWGVRAMEALFFNTLGGDGMYYEGSYGYSLGASTIFLDIALMGMQASTDEQLQSFHPFGCERLYRFAVELPGDMLCQGHMPCYGDWKTDKRTGTEADAKVLSYAYRGAAAFARHSPDAGLRKRAGEQLRRLYPHVLPQLGKLGLDLFGEHPEPADAGRHAFALPERGTLLGQAGLAILRDANETTVLLRYGPGSVHGHDDALALQLYACGQEVTADIGYLYYGSNGHLGWASKAIAHNTVVVDRDSRLPGRSIYKPFAGGELLLFHESANASALEASAPDLYGVETYRRLLALVPLAGGSSYVVDVFAVDGAETADYAFHAFHEPSELALSGALAVETAGWTLEGHDEACAGSPRPYYDHPTQSFGERLTAGETFDRCLEDEHPRGWTPIPNNGYGYVFDLKRYEPDDGGFVAVWRSESGRVLRLFGLTEEKDRLFTGKGPSLQGEQRHPMLIWRSGARKRFSAIMQALPAASETGYDGVLVKEVRQVDTGSGAMTGMKVVLSDGSADYWVYGVDAGTAVVQTTHGPWRVAGRCAWIRLSANGELLRNELIDGASTSFGSCVLQAPVEHSVPIAAVDAAEGTIALAEPMASGQDARGWVRIRSARTGRTAVYRLRSLTKDRMTILLSDSPILSKGVVQRVSVGEQDGLTRLDSRYPLPLGSDLVHPGAASPFEGRTIRGAWGGTAVIRGVPAMKRLVVEISVPFRQEEPFDILGIEAGDAVLQA